MKRRASAHFERAILASLERGARTERFGLQAFARAQVVRALERDLDGGDALGAIEGALRLAAAFDGQLRSPSVAALIREILRENPRAVSVLRARRKTGQTIDAVRRFAQREGRAEHVRAPVLDEAPPAGTIPLRSLIEPGGSLIARRRQPSGPR